MQALFTALCGPVFTKEMLELARRRRYYVVRTVYGLGIFFVLFINFQSYNWRMLQPDGANIRLMAEFAESMFRSVGITEFIALFALVPMFLCGTIASEREETTLELLFTTTLLDREIIVGKMLSRLVIFGLLFAMALPIFGLISLFGGISPPALFRLGAAMLAALIYVGAYSTYYSTVTKSPMGALLRTYWQLGLRLLILPYMIMMIAFWWSITGAPQMVPYILTIICCTNPIAPLMIAVVPEMYQGAAGQAGRFGPLIAEWFFPLLFVIPLMRAGWLTWKSTRRLRLTPVARRSFLRHFLPFRRPHTGTRVARPARRGFFNSSTETWLRLFPVRNPLWLRARQCHCFDREGHLVRLQGWAWVVAGAFLVLVAVGEYLHSDRIFRSPEIALAFLPVTYVTVGIFFTIVASISVVGDRRRGFLDTVLTTPLTSQEIVDGTFLAIWAHVKRLSWLPLALAGLFLFSGAGKLPDLAISLAIAGAYMAALVLVGIGCSLSARTLAGALVPTLIFLLIPNLGILFLSPIFMRYAPFALCFLCVAGLLIASAWVRYKITPASVGCYMLFVFQCLVTGSTVLIAWRDSHDGWELVSASMPTSSSFTALSPHRSSWDNNLPYGEWMRLCHLLGITVFCFWARWWLIRHFEAFAGRALIRNLRPGTIAGAIAAVVHFFYWRIPEAVRPRWQPKLKPGAPEIESAVSDGA